MYLRFSMCPCVFQEKVGASHIIVIIAYFIQWGPEFNTWEGGSRPFGTQTFKEKNILSTARVGGCPKVHGSARSGLAQGGSKVYFLENCF